MSAAAIFLGLLLGAVWVTLEFRSCINPYSRDGLQCEWSYGATSTVPSVQMWVDYRGARIESPIFFGGLNDPWLRFSDYDGDGRRDIIFRNRNFQQIVAFAPGTSNSPPAFAVLRNDVTWP